MTEFSKSKGHKYRNRRTDRHEKEGYPFVSRVCHSHVLNRRCLAAVRRRIRSPRTPRPRLARSEEPQPVRIVVGQRYRKRDHDRRPEPELYEGEREPGLGPQSASVRAVQKVGQYEAGQLEEPRDERREHERGDRARGQLVDKHVPIEVEPRWRMNRVVPVGRRGVRRRGHVGLGQHERGSRCIGVKGVTYRRSLLLRLFRHHVDVAAVSHDGYRWRGLRRYVCEDTVVVGPAASGAIVADALMGLRE